MEFNLEKLFVDVFAPQVGDVVTFILDLPHGELKDNDRWRQRRQMAERWHAEVDAFSEKYGISIEPIVTYAATGAHSADLPEEGLREGERVQIETAIKGSTIVIAMTEYSASAPLLLLARKYRHLRIASMPMVSESMQETGLAADYQLVAKKCARLAPHFEKANGVKVTFSTGHKCYFDISNHNQVFQDTGLLHLGSRGGAPLLSNLPAGEVFTCPNEANNSKTAGEIPVMLEDETIVFVVRRNQITDVIGEGPIAAKERQRYRAEVALCNIAEVAIGCNDKAVVTGNILEDEKAGFHWAYGRSDHFGGQVGVKSFSSPEKVAHVDIVYAKGNPIVCSKLDFIFPDGTRKTVIVEGELIL